MEEFELFWREFPRKLAKGDARKAWAQTQAIRPEITTVLTALKAAKKSEQWQRDEGRYIPYPATWLRAERWDDVHEIDYGKDIVNGKEWHETGPGIIAKGKELGLEQRTDEQWYEFRTRVYRAAGNQSNNVKQLRAV